MKVQVVRNMHGEIISISVPPPMLAAENSELLEVPEDSPLAWAAARHPICEQTLVEVEEQLKEVVDWATAALSEINGTFDYLRKLDRRGPGWARKGMEEKNEP